MARKGENIYKRKDGRWEGRYIKSRSLEGKIKYGYIYAKSYREVKQKLYENRKNYLISSNNSADNKTKIIFRDIAGEWLKVKKPQLKESTYVKYRNLLNTYILPAFGNVSLEKFTCDYVKSFCDDLLSYGGKQGNGLSPKTVSDTLSLIRNIFKYSAERGSVSGYDLSFIQIKQKPKELRIFSRQEEEQLCHFLYANQNLRNIGILICLFTGIRIGELCALCWEDISLKEHTIHIHQTMQRVQIENDSARKTKVIVTPPKSSYSVRTIPLPERLVEILKSFQCSSGYLLSGTDQSCIEPRLMQYYFKYVLKQCSIKTANYHSLRHTFATRCVELGIDVKSLSEILGHSSVTITMNRYVHPSMELKQEYLERLSELFAVR